MSCASCKWWRRIGRGAYGYCCAPDAKARGLIAADPYWRERPTDNVLTHRSHGTECAAWA